MPVSELARETVVTAAPDEPAAELAELMRDQNVGSVVVTIDEKPVGIVTDRDLVTKVFADGIVPPSVTARDVMTEDVQTVERDASTFELCEAMCDAQVRRMPVMDEGRLVGIITMDDVVRMLAEEFDRLASVIAAESPPY